MPSVRFLDSALATYCYAVTQLVVGTSAADAWQLQGANNIKVRPRWIMVGGIVSSGGTIRTQTVALVKRSAGGTGGTSTTPTIQKADSSDAASACILTQWTGAGTPGASIGTIDTISFSMQKGATNAISQDRAIFNYESSVLKPIYLNSNAEFLCVSLAGVATVNTTDLFDFSMWWTESGS